MSRDVAAVLGRRSGAVELLLRRGPACVSIDLLSIAVLPQPVRSLMCLHQGVVAALQDGRLAALLHEDALSTVTFLHVGFAVDLVVSDLSACIVAVAGRDCDVRILDPARLLASAKSAPHGELEPACVLSGHQAAITCLAFSRDASRLVSGSRDCALIVWDVADGVVRHTLSGHSDVVTCAAFSCMDRDVVVSGSTDGSVRLWRQGTCVLAVQDHALSVTRVALVASSGSGDARLLSASRSKCVVERRVPQLQLTGSTLAQHVFDASVNCMEVLAPCVPGGDDVTVAGLGDGCVAVLGPGARVVQHIAPAVPGDSIWALAVAPTPRSSEGLMLASVMSLFHLVTDEDVLAHKTPTPKRTLHHPRLVVVSLCRHRRGPVALKGARAQPHSASPTRCACQCVLLLLMCFFVVPTDSLLDLLARLNLHKVRRNAATLLSHSA